MNHNWQMHFYSAFCPLSLYSLNGFPCKISLVTLPGSLLLIRPGIAPRRQENVLVHSQTVHQSAGLNVQLLHLENNCTLQRTKKSVSYLMVTEMLKQVFFLKWKNYWNPLPTCIKHYRNIMGFATFAIVE